MDEQVLMVVAKPPVGCGVRSSPPAGRHGAGGPGRIVGVEPRVLQISKAVDRAVRAHRRDDATLQGLMGAGITPGPAQGGGCQTGEQGRRRECRDRAKALDHGGAEGGNRRFQPEHEPRERRLHERPARPRLVAAGEPGSPRGEVSEAARFGPRHIHGAERENAALFPGVVRVVERVKVRREGSDRSGELRRYGLAKGARQVPGLTIAGLKKNEGRPRVGGGGAALGPGRDLGRKVNEVREHHPGEGSVADVADQPFDVHDGIPVENPGGQFGVLDGGGAVARVKVVEGREVIALGFLRVNGKGVRDMNRRLRYWRLDRW